MVKCVIDTVAISHFPSPKCEVGTHAEVPVPAGGNNTYVYILKKHFSIYTLYIILFCRSQYIKYNLFLNHTC